MRRNAKNRAHEQPLLQEKTGVSSTAVIENSELDQGLYRFPIHLHIKIHTAQKKQRGLKGLVVQKSSSKNL